MNPAIPRLLRLHGASRVRRLRATFSNRRRALLTLAALLFGMIWLGQTIAVVLFREPYDPATFRRWTSLILMSYFGWHFLRVAYKRPDDAIEWSPAEAEHIVGGPFTRRDVLTYRFLVILTSTLPKAVVTAFVLLPDLWWSGLPGIVLALVFLECVRTALDIAVCCLSDRSYLAARLIVFGLILTAMIALFSPVASTSGTVAAGAGNPSSRLAQFTAAAHTIRTTQPIVTIEKPFVTFANIITAQQTSTSLLVDTAIVLTLIGGLLILIVGLDRRHETLTHQRQRAIHDPESSLMGRTLGASTAVASLPSVPRLGTIGPVVWRQLKAAGRFRGSLFVALAIPAVMSFGPFYSVPDATLAFLVLVGTVLFYSFVLLPEAIKFDFRLDCDHLVQLKLLPISPARVVLGQLAVPILITTLFQVTLFLFAGAVRPVSPTLIISAVLLTLPVNGLFVAIDNLIFLLYPHRPTQEGFEAFLRTMLKFTFKSVLLGVIGVVLFFFALASRLLVDAAGVPHVVQWVFLASMTLVAWLSAVLAIALVTRAFHRFDVSLSVPT